MENTEINWENKQQVKEEIKSFVSDLRDEFMNERQKNPKIYEHDFIIKEICFSSYTTDDKKAQCVALAFDVSPFDSGILTEIRYNSWEPMAFDAIYREYFNQE